MKNGCVKGKVGEREWRDELRAQGFTARRGQQFAGGPDSPDVICEELGAFHFEVKRVEKLNVLDAMLQAIRDCGRKTPVLAHRRNRSPWLVTMRADEWFALIREALPLEGLKISGTPPRLGYSKPGELQPSALGCPTAENVRQYANEVRAWRTLNPDAPRPARGGWAPGGYLCTCIQCSTLFNGEKRALQCADCAYDAPIPEPAPDYSI